MPIHYFKKSFAATLMGSSIWAKDRIGKEILYLTPTFKVPCGLCFIELCLRLLAARTTPVVWQVLESYTVVFSRIVQIATDRANILAGIFFLGEIYLCQYSRHGIVQIHHALGLQVLIALRRMGAAIYGRLMANELTYAVHRFAGCSLPHHQMRMAENRIRLCGILLL